VRQTVDVAISDDDIAKVRDATDFVAIASEHLQLTRAGNRFKGLCPFHSEKSPSFTINPEKRLYYCFGCQAKGDVIRFVMELEHLDFAGAVEKLAAKAGVSIRYDSEATGRDRKRREKLRTAMDEAVEWYHQQLLTSPGAGKARGYLKSRGYDGEAVRAFRLGWAPDGWDTLNKALRLPTDIAKDTGLGYLNRQGRVNDFFQSRILFPIFDVSGQAIAFGGRKLPEAEGPKYKNSSETALYSKSRTLYGLNWAKSGIVADGEVIVCEGYTDVIAFHRAGLARAVATCGTALADEHFNILKNFARRIVLAYDADAAGQNAAEKFYAWEKRYEIDLAVVALPPGADPAELAQSDPEALRAAVAGAKPFLAFRLDRSMLAADLRTPEGRGRAFEHAVAIIAEHPSPYVREQYVREIADRCRISEPMMVQVLSDLADPKRNAALRKLGPSSGVAGKGAGTGGPSGSGAPRRTAREQVPPPPEPGGASASKRPLPRAAGDGGFDDAPPPDERFRPNDDDPGPPPPPDDRFVSDRSFGSRSNGPNHLKGPSGFDRPTPAQRRSATRQNAGTIANAANTRTRAAEEQLLIALIHAPETVVAYCVESIFVVPVHARACVAMMEYGDVGPAIDAASDDPELELLLQRLAVEQPSDDPADSAALVVSAAVARAVDALKRHPDHPEWPNIPTLLTNSRFLADPLVRSAALDQLVPWFFTWGISITENQ
jgi:DNA primase